MTTESPPTTTTTTTTETEPLTAAAPVTALALAESDDDLGDGISVHRGVAGVDVVSRRRNVGLAVFLTLFCVVWDVVVVGIGVGGDAPTWMIAHALAGIFVTAWWADTVLNHTRISLAHGRLLARRHPLPWPGAVDVALDDVERAYVADGNVKDNGRPLPALWIALRSGGSKIVLGVLPNAAHGQRLAKVLMDHVVAARS